jgi:pyruvate dehydrogenase E1 component beta subunit
VTRQLTFLQGAYEAQAEEMRRDDRAILLGQDIEASLYGASENFVDIFGSSRVRNLPISEAATVGMAAGAAMTGLRPIVDMTMSNFLYVAMDQFVNQVAKNRYMFGGQAKLPIVFRTSLFYQGGNAAHHSDRPYPMFMQVPGIKVIVPTSGPDLKGLLKAAIRDDNPVICFEDANLWSRRGRADLPDVEDHVIPLGQGNVRRQGTDVTIVGIANGLLTSLEAAEVLAGSGISAEVIDPRTLVPMDWDLIGESVSKTNRLVVVDPATATCSAASEIAATVVERHWDVLSAPVLRVNTPDVHIPYSAALEPQLYPSVDRVVAQVTKVISA